MERKIFIKNFIALGRPGEHYGAGRIQSTEEKWREVAAKAIKKSEGILIIASHEAGIIWELSYIIKNGYLNKCIFLIPPRRIELDDWKKTVVFCQEIGLDLSPLNNLLKDKKDYVGLLYKFSNLLEMSIIRSFLVRGDNIFISSLDITLPNNFISNPIFVYGSERLNYEKIKTLIKNDFNSSQKVEIKVPDKVNELIKIFENTLLSRLKILFRISLFLSFIAIIIFYMLSQDIKEAHILLQFFLFLLLGNFCFCICLYISCIIFCPELNNYILCEYNKNNPLNNTDVYVTYYVKTQNEILNSYIGNYVFARAMVQNHLLPLILLGGCITLCAL